MSPSQVPRSRPSPREPGGIAARLRLRPPTSAEGLLQRTRLMDLLDEVVAASVTTVVSPAGSGKTSLLVTWRARSALPSAWLSLDEADRDPVQLGTDLIAALEPLAPGCGRRASLLLRRPRERAAALPALLDDLAAVDLPPGGLVVEDVHLVDRGRAGAALAGFLQGLPPWLHVIASSRRDLPLPVDRLRARGALREVRFAELRFSEEEAGALMHRLAPGLSAADVAQAAHASGGWAASLRLSALAERAHQARPELAPPDADGRRLLADYLWNELLVNEPPALVDTLRAVSVVDRADAGLAAALTGRADAEADLAEAERRGLFVSRVADTGWYELHALVRELLLDDLTKRAPDLLRDLRGRAARWFEDHDEIPFALEYWVAGGHAREALHLLAAGSAGLYDRGREAVIARTLHAIPVGVATSDMEALAEYAWCHLLIDRHRFVELVDELARWSEDASLHDEQAAVPRSRIGLLRSIASTVRGDWSAGGRQAREALAGFGPQWWLDLLGRFGWNVVARDIALSERWDDLAHEVTEATAALSVDPERRIAFEGTRALGEALAGRPVDALRIAAGVRRSAEVANMTILRSELSLAEAMSRRELGDRARSVPALVELTLDPAEATPYTQLLAHLELAGAYRDGGDLATSRRSFAAAEEMVRSECGGVGASDLLATAGTTAALAEGDVDGARRWAGRTLDEFWAGIGAGRVLLADFDPAAAGAVLERLVPRSPRQRVVHQLLLARSCASTEEATKHVIDAVEVASGHSLLQTVASEGADAVALVELAAWRSPTLWLDRLRRAATPTLGPVSVPAPELVETLTERERDVLRLLPSRLTMREIADELRISGNTLKFHLRGIYRKLDCGTRGEAAAIAVALARAGRPHSPRSLRR